MNPYIEDTKRSLSEAAHAGSKVLGRTLESGQRLAQKAEGPSRKVLAVAQRAGKAMGEEMTRAGVEGKRVRLLSHVRTGREAIDEMRKSAALPKVPSLKTMGKAVAHGAVAGTSMIGTEIVAHIGAETVMGEFEKRRKKANQTKPAKIVPLHKQADAAPDGKNDTKKRIDAEHAAGVMGTAYFGQGIARTAHGLLSNDFGWKAGEDIAKPGLFNKTKGLSKIKGKQWPFALAGAAAGAYTGHRLSEKYRRSHHAKTQPRNPDGSFAQTS